MRIFLIFISVFQFGLSQKILIPMDQSQKNDSFYQLISNIKKKDFVKNGRLDVIYNNDDLPYIRPKYSCKIGS